MRKILALTTALTLTACSLIPEYSRPAAPVPQAFPNVAGGTRQAQDLPWREFFPDARLQALIEAALDHNRDMKIAIARVEEARALAGIARADRLPQIDAQASINRSRTPGDLNTTGRSLTGGRYDAGLGVAAFELDFWGRVASLDEAARAQYLASFEAQRAFRIGIVADVANAYLTWLEAGERETLTLETLKTREKTRELVLRRREVGLANDLDFLAADGALEAVRAQLAEIRRQRETADNALRLLVGATLPLPAGRGLAEQGIVADLAAGIPSEALLVRPDVMSAEQRLMAANANVGAARAAFFPRIALTASLGTASSALSGLFDAGSGAWAFAPVLKLPLFDAGRTQANVDLAEARKVIAVAEYEKTIQQAFREVADGLASRRHLTDQLVAQEANLRAQAERLKRVEARLAQGVASYLEVLDAQRDHYAAEQALVATRRQLLSAAVSLYKALGGGRV